MALFHSFLLFPDSGVRYDHSRAMTNDPDAVRLHDDLFGYMYNTFCWIPTIHPSREPTDNDYHQFGLYRWGPTAINANGARKAMAVFFGWAALLAEGPGELQLTGVWEWTEGEDVSNGSFHIIRANRDDVTHALRTIGEYCEKALSGKYYVLHGGV